MTKPLHLTWPILCQGRSCSHFHNCVHCAGYLNYKVADEYLNLLIWAFFPLTITIIANVDCAVKHLFH